MVEAMLFVVATATALGGSARVANPTPGVLAASCRTSCGSALPFGRSGERPSSLQNLSQELSVAVRARLAALIARDRAALENLLVPAFRYTNASGRVFGRDAYITTYALDSAVVWSSQAFSDVCITLCGDVAVLTALIRDVARFGDRPLDASFRTTQVYRREGGVWKYVAGHTSTPE